LDKTPVGYLRIYFPLEVGRLLEREDIDNKTRSPIVRVIERKLNTRVARAEQLIEPDHAGDDAARHLNIDPQVPILRVTRVYYTTFDQPIEVALMRYHPDHYKYSIDYRAGLIRR
jgi:GntR family transcriptional regulator